MLLRLSIPQNQNGNANSKNDSIAIYDNCGMQLVLKKTRNKWKVLSWTETY